METISKDALVAEAKDLGIKSPHLMNVDTLQERIAEAKAEKTPVISEERVPDDPDAEALAERQAEAKAGAENDEMRNMIAEMAARLDDLEDENKELKDRVKSIPLRDIPERPNPNVMRYKLVDGKVISRQMSPKVANHSEKDGWVDSPAKLEGHEPMKPKKVLGEKVEGKIVEIED